MADGSCQEKCHSNVHCPKEHICFSDGTCKLACNIYKQTCPSGQYCHLDHEVCHNFCKSHQECSRGYACYKSQCHKDCFVSDDCGNDQICQK